MKFTNPQIKIESLTDLDIVLEVSAHPDNTNVSSNSSTKYSDSDFGF